jgi:3-oxoacyl-[acyl-carrier protein] reductase
MNILVTGAGRGIGNALVKELASRGDNTVIALSRNSSKIKELAKFCSEKFISSRVIDYTMDLEGNDETFLELEDFIRKNQGTLDILVNNAGYLVNKPFSGMQIEDEKRMWSINYLAASRLSRLLIALMAKNKKGHIVNISSMGGVQGSQKFAGLSSYSASKAALAVLTECLAEEYKNKNLAVNCIALGAVQTEMLEEAFPGYKAGTEPEELAVHLADFCLKGMQYCNGKILPFSLTQP